MSTNPDLYMPPPAWMWMHVLMEDGPRARRRPACSSAPHGMSAAGLPQSRVLAQHHASCRVPTTSERSTAPGKTPRPGGRPRGEWGAQSSPGVQRRTAAMAARSFASSALSGLPPSAGGATTDRPIGTVIQSSRPPSSPPSAGASPPLAPPPTADAFPPPGIPVVVVRAVASSSDPPGSSPVPGVFHLSA